MKTSLVLAAVLAAALVAPTRSHAVWGAKARACPRWEAKLAALEQSGEPPDSARLRALRAKIDGRCVALNEIQVLGSHNSFHIQARPALFALLAAFSPELAASLEYTHIPLPDQFSNEGVRQIELDVFADPAGGLYDLRRGLLLIGLPADSGIPALEQPGFKVLHVQDVDFETTCVTFVECLQVGGVGCRDVQAVAAFVQRQNPPRLGNAGVEVVLVDLVDVERRQIQHRHAERPRGEDGELLRRKPLAGQDELDERHALRLRLALQRLGLGLGHDAVLGECAGETADVAGGGVRGHSSSSVASLPRMPPQRPGSRTKIVRS